MDWTQVLTVFVIVATNLGTVIILHCHLDSSLRISLDEHRKDTNLVISAIQSNIQAIQQEMKDFHGRLCSIEEKIKK